MASPLHVVVVGAGLGGLACAIGCRKGFRVTVLEQASQLSEIGAGIQIPPNAARINASLGLLDRLVSEGGAELIEAHHYVRYSDGKPIVTRPDTSWMRKQYGYGWYVIHRADYLNILVTEARLIGVEIRLGAVVRKTDCEAPSVELESGESVTADVIIGADGLHSIVRRDVLGREIKPTPSGDLAYRATIPRARVESLNDPILNRMLQQHESQVWWGNDSHAVLYPVRHTTIFNLVLLVPDTLPANVLKEGSIDQMRKLFEGWDPTLRRLIAEVPASLKWKFVLFDTLKTWTKGSVALLGDACHPTFPYPAQGAAMAVEDGACLAKLLGLASKGSQTAHLPEVLELYEDLRKDRTTLNVKGAADNRAVYHATDGEAADRRNALLQDYDWDGDPRETPLSFNDAKYQRNLMGFDTVGNTEVAFYNKFGGSKDSVRVMP